MAHLLKKRHLLDADLRVVNALVEAVSHRSRDDENEHQRDHELVEVGRKGQKNAKLNRRRTHFLARAIVCKRSAVGAY